MFESVRYGVPTVGIPIYYDQFDRAAKLVDKGAAVALSKGATADEMREAIEEVVNNPR